MGLLDVALAPLRAALGTAERETESLLPVREIEEIQAQVLSTAEAIRTATESIESHIKMVETLAGSIDPLTLAVAELTRQLAEINQVLVPLAGMERDVSRVEHFFSRRRHPDPPPPEPTAR